MSNHPSVYVVTPVHNGLVHTIEFLRSLNRQTYKNLAVIIVDDGSTDETAQTLKSDFPKAIVLTGTGNLWWSGATNKGVSYALARAADYIFTVNNDVELDPQAIASLVRYAEAHPNTLIGSTVFHKEKPNKIWYAGGTFDQNKGDVIHINELRDAENLQCDWLTGMGVLVPAKVFVSVGLYNEKNFPQYFGDADFSIRAKQAGFRLMVAQSSKLYVDTQSAWINKNFSKKPFSFLLELFFSTRSQYYLPARIKFYYLYWPGNPWSALFKLYRGVIKEFVRPFIGSKLKGAVMSIRGYRAK